MLPAITFDGKIILDSKHHISLAPSGNGAVYQALNDSGALNLLEGKNIEYLHSFSIDNVLNLVCDPVFIGFTDINGYDLSSKAVEKIDPKEPVGIIAMKNGAPGVVEYSELGE